eukprot:TRINITY_DN11101_c0_g1_i1.p1 TRINITY_DN11101_c0_g1~~TRINITY_DN11101_c0_g1_i1.p1  ORF type:complete len:168 (+),score=66.16 TRINITY_DN11101_c0_g1_i1:118-621(+)
MLRFEEAYPELEEQRLISERDKQFDQSSTEHIQVQLAAAVEQRDAVYAQAAAYLELASKISVVQDNKLNSFKSLVNLGSDFFVQAKVPETSMVFVNVGMQLHVEMTLPEAQAFAADKQLQLTAQADSLTKRIADLKMRLALHGLRQQQQTEQHSSSSAAAQQLLLAS